jgi:oligopeptide/dipeptide ABC transporter ATP-binding protein
MIARLFAHKLCDGRGIVSKLLEIENLQTHFFTSAGVVRAVDGISYDVDEGETIAIVGESGCGKSVSALSVLRLVASPPGRVVGGRIRFKGRDLLQLSEEEIRHVRGRDIAMVFQEPMTSLNPVLTVGRQLTETLQQHLDMSREQADARAIELLGLVGIAEPERRLKQYPHHFSGGMRQRVMIAMALCCNPKLIIADEPTTALDVTIQAQILYEAQKLCRESGTALIWITHDLSVVAGLADRICVMYAGRIVESGTVDEVLDAPLHPYTQGLIGSVPSRNRRGSPLAQIPGMMPSLTELPPGCAFRGRCARAAEACTQQPELRELGSRLVRCFHPL